jgi:hypothetical protein
MAILQASIGSFLCWSGGASGSATGKGGLGTRCQPRTVCLLGQPASLADFVDGAVVSLSNYGALDTVFVSATSLTAMLPAGIAPGSYTLSVVNPDASSVSFPNAVTVEHYSTTGPSPEDTTPIPISAAGRSGY